METEIKMLSDIHKNADMGQDTLRHILDATKDAEFSKTVSRQMQEYEKAGAAAVLFEDQVWPKRCGHMVGKQVIDASEHAKKLRAAADARTDEDFLLIARTDARAVNGLEDAVERGKLYLDNGAEALFIEAPQDRSCYESFSRYHTDS